MSSFVQLRQICIGLDSFAYLLNLSETFKEDSKPPTPIEGSRVTVVNVSEKCPSDPMSNGIISLISACRNRCSVPYQFDVEENKDMFPKPIYVFQIDNERIYDAYYFFLNPSTLFERGGILR